MARGKQPNRYRALPDAPNARKRRRSFKKGPAAMAARSGPPQSLSDPRTGRRNPRAAAQAARAERRRLAKLAKTVAAASAAPPRRAPAARGISNGSTVPLWRPVSSRKVERAKRAAMANLVNQTSVSAATSAVALAVAMPVPPAAAAAERPITAKPAVHAKQLRKQQPSEQLLPIAETDEMDEMHMLRDLASGSLRAVAPASRPLVRKIARLRADALQRRQLSGANGIGDLDEEIVNVNDDLLTQSVGEGWEYRSVRSSGTRSTERMGTVCSTAIGRIGDLAASAQLPIVDVGFGYGQVLWQLFMAGCDVIGGMESAREYVAIAREIKQVYFAPLQSSSALQLDHGYMSRGWLDQQPRLYYMNNLALDEKQNEALWSIFSHASRGSIVLSTCVLVFIRNAENGWRMHYDGVAFSAIHSTNKKGKPHERGLVVYTKYV